MNDFFFACSGVSFDDQLHSCQLAFEVQLCMRPRTSLMFMIKNDCIELIRPFDLTVCVLFSNPDVIMITPITMIVLTTIIAGLGIDMGTSLHEGGINLLMYILARKEIIHKMLNNFFNMTIACFASNW